MYRIKNKENHIILNCLKLTKAQVSYILSSKEVNKIIDFLVDKYHFTDAHPLKRYVNNEKLKEFYKKESVQKKLLGMCK